MRNHWKGWQLGWTQCYSDYLKPLVLFSNVHSPICWSSLYVSHIGMGRVLSQYRSRLNTTDIDSIIFVQCSWGICSLRDCWVLVVWMLFIIHFWNHYVCIFIIIGSPSRNVYVIIWIRLTLCFSPFHWSIHKVQKSQVYSLMNFYKLSTHMWPVPREIAQPALETLCALPAPVAQG